MQKSLFMCNFKLTPRTFRPTQILRYLKGVSKKKQSAKVDTVYKAECLKRSKDENAN